MTVAVLKKLLRKLPPTMEVLGMDYDYMEEESLLEPLDKLSERIMFRCEDGTWCDPDPDLPYSGTGIPETVLLMTLGNTHEAALEIREENARLRQNKEAEESTILDDIGLGHLAKQGA